MQAIKDYLVPFIISNILFVLSIVAATKRPKWARAFLAAFFLWASLTNLSYAISRPEIYLEYGKLTFLPFYEDFINGYFSQHITQLVSLIAFFQMAIFIGILLNKFWVRLASIGGMIFGMAIAPLGVGSAFPSTVFMAISFLILYFSKDQDFIWKKSKPFLRDNMKAGTQ
ncbi:MAG: hypothetical protein ACHQET_00840 [Chitinophagales bacterium]